MMAPMNTVMGNGGVGMNMAMQGRVMGLLKLHLKAAHIENNEFNFDSMSPYVVIRIGQ